MRLILGVTLLMLATLVHSLSFSCRDGSAAILDVGVTSLLARQQKGNVELFAGTKRGKIHRFTYNDSESQIIQSLGEIHDEETKPFPIFSMASSTTDDASAFQLFCGGGDRFISVWQQEEPNKWVCRQRLGPHTGWVKDLLFVHNNEEQDALYSIGCNCIESWQRDQGSSSLWKHDGKRFIESSLKEGATLSSDLLCLCASNEEDSLFFAGGVDGRIHAWSCDTAMKDPLYSIGAHNGRVNVMSFAGNASLLFSTGHDGTIQCRRVVVGSELSKMPEAQINVLDAVGDPARITALTIVEERRDNVQLVAGTANGELACIQAALENDSAWVLTECPDERYHFADKPMINAFCSLTPPQAFDSPRTLAVGHSLGLSLITVHS